MERKITPLKYEMFMRGIKQKDMAMRTGICASAVSSFVNNVLTPTEKQMELIAKVVGVPVKKIFPKGK